MSVRLTSEWKESTKEAFGVSGEKGDAGEMFLCKVFDDWGWDYILHSSSRYHQTKGIDISFKKPSWKNFYTADVKNNLNDSGNFFIETDPLGWLFKPTKTSDRIWHVNCDNGMMAWYDRNQMKNYIIECDLYDTGLMMFDRKVDFVTKSKYHTPLNDGDK